MHSLLHDAGAGYWLGHLLMLLLMITILALALLGSASAVGLANAQGMQGAAWA
ncbi:MAG: hypothetical protein JJU06_21800 [Ectothiorhodospiraceae bacterium]|nr:hypothetical protein [Ectothiorhodospiraceae bacterium]